MNEMRNMKSLRVSDGFSLIEVMVASFFLLVVMLGVLPVFTRSLVTNQMAYDNTRAAAFARSEELIDGRVRLELYKGGVQIAGRESPSSLYDRELSSMDVEGGYDQTDARGFIRINSLRLQAHKLILRRSEEDGGDTDQVAATAAAETEDPAGTV